MMLHRPTMTPSISELNDWFRSERFAATHNALYEIMIEGRHADTLDEASLLLARIRMNMGHVDTAILQLAHGSPQSIEDRACRHALMALGYALKRCFGLSSGSLERARPAGSAGPFVDLCEAMIRTEQGRIVQAATLYRRCLGDHADRRFAYKGLAEVLRAAGDVEEADAVLADLLEVEPRWAGTHRALAYHAMASRRPADAVSHLRRALDEAPDGDIALMDVMALGRSLHESGDTRAAIETLEPLLVSGQKPPMRLVRMMERLRIAPSGSQTYMISHRPVIAREDCGLPGAVDLAVRIAGREPPRAGGTSGRTDPWSVLSMLRSAKMLSRMVACTQAAIRSAVQADLPVITFEDAHISGLPSVIVGLDDTFHEAIAMDPATGLLRRIPLDTLTGEDRKTTVTMIAMADEGRSESVLDEAGLAHDAHLELCARADSMRDSGDLAGAEALYRDVIARAHGHLPGHSGLLGVLMGRISADDGAYADFKKALDDASEVPGSSAMVNAFEGRLRTMMGQHRRALACFAKASEAAPDDIHVMCERASCLLVTGAGQQAAGLFREALTVAPHHPRPNLDLADFLASHSDLEGAEHHAMCGLDLAPDSAFGHEILARVHRARGDSAAALDSIDRAMALGSNTDWAHLERGVNLMDLGRWSEARDELAMVASRDASSIEARTRLVQVLSKLNMAADALETARTLLMLDPASASSREMLGLAHETAGQDEDARESYLEALAREPGRITTLRRLDGMLRKRSAIQDRVGLWLAASRRDPANPDVLVELASALEEEGKKKEAETVLRRAAIAGGGPAAASLPGLRDICARSENPVQVLEDAAGQQGEDTSMILAELGRLLVLAGDPRATAVFRDVATREPTDPTVIAMLAHSLRAWNTSLVEDGEPAGSELLESAAAIMDHALDMEPYWVWARIERALIALDMSKPADALAVLEPVTEDLPRAWEARMRASAMLGKHDLASLAADRWLAASNDEVAPEVLIDMADAHIRAGNGERAADMAHRVLDTPGGSTFELRTSAEAILAKTGSRI